MNRRFSICASVEGVAAGTKPGNVPFLYMGYPGVVDIAAIIKKTCYLQISWSKSGNIFREHIFVLKLNCEVHKLPECKLKHKIIMINYFKF